MKMPIFTPLHLFYIPVHSRFIPAFFHVTSLVSSSISCKKNDGCKNDFQRFRVAHYYYKTVERSGVDRPNCWKIGSWSPKPLKDRELIAKYCCCKLQYTSMRLTITFACTSGNCTSWLLLDFNWLLYACQVTTSMNVYTPAQALLPLPRGHTSSLLPNSDFSGDIFACEVVALTYPMYLPYIYIQIHICIYL
jgi:hypothetical protein